MLKAAAYITALTASWAQSLFAVVLLETSSSVVYMNLLCFSPAETVTDLKCKDWRKSGHELENVLVCLDQKSHRTGPFRNNHVCLFFFLTSCMVTSLWLLWTQNSLVWDTFLYFESVKPTLSFSDAWLCQKILMSSETWTTFSAFYAPIMSPTVPSCSSLIGSVWWDRPPRAGEKQREWNVMLVVRRWKPPSPGSRISTLISWLVGGTASSSELNLFTGCIVQDGGKNKGGPRRRPINSFSLQLLMKKQTSATVPPELWLHVDTSSASSRF